MKKITWFILLGAAAAIVLSGCAATAPDPEVTRPPQSPSPRVYNSVSPTGRALYRDGEYIAEASPEETEKNHGWKEYVKIKVDGGVIVKAEYDAVKDGKKKSELTKEEYPMEPHPSVWIPELNARLNKASGPDDIDGITGATQSSQMVKKLFEEVLRSAQGLSVQGLSVQGPSALGS